MSAKGELKIVDIPSWKLDIVSNEHDSHLTEQRIRVRSASSIFLDVMYLDLKIMSNFYNQEQDRYPTKQCEREARAEIFNIVTWKGT